ncbi:hypothetical protein NDU88_005684, partial [Pleurodeles waltl]
IEPFRDGHVDAMSTVKRSVAQFSVDAGSLSYPGCGPRATLEFVVLAPAAVRKQQKQRPRTRQVNYLGSASRAPDRRRDVSEPQELVCPLQLVLRRDEQDEQCRDCMKPRAHGLFQCKDRQKVKSKTVQSNASTTQRGLE